MAVIIDPQSDNRAERMLEDPDAYFASERERIRLQVEEEMRREERTGRRRIRRTAP